MGDSDLSPGSDPGPIRGLVVFPADDPIPGDAEPHRGGPLEEWWLVLGAIAVAAALVVIALLVR